MIRKADQKELEIHLYVKLFIALHMQIYIMQTNFWFYNLIFLAMYKFSVKKCP